MAGATVTRTCMGPVRCVCFYIIAHTRACLPPPPISPGRLLPSVPSLLRVAEVLLASLLQSPPLPRRLSPDSPGPLTALLLGRIPPSLPSFPPCLFLLLPGLLSIAPLAYRGWQCGRRLAGGPELRLQPKLQGRFLLQC